MAKLTIISDIHGAFKAFDTIAEKTNANYIIQCGDFGVWNSDTKHFLKYSGKAPVYWIRGNHENHDMLDNIFGKDDGNHKIQAMKSEYFPHVDNIFLCNSGTVLKLGNKKVLVLGGADSIDKARRIEFSSWWRQEIPSKECQENVLNADYSDIDIVVSHTAPAFVVEKMPLINTHLFTDEANYHDPTTDYLEECYKSIKSKNNKLKQWVYGHFHMSFNYKSDDCNFTALNTLNPHNVHLINKDCYTVIDLD